MNAPIAQMVLLTPRLARLREQTPPGPQQTIWTQCGIIKPRRRALLRSLLITRWTERRTMDSRWSTKTQRAMRLKARMKRIIITAPFKTLLALRQALPGRQELKKPIRPLHLMPQLARKPLP